MDNNVQNRKQSEDFLTITDLWHLCVAHWNWFLVSLLVCVGYACYYLAVTPNIYTRQAAILVKQESQKTSRQATDNEVLSDVSVVQQQTNVPNVQRQLKSLGVLREVALRLYMADDDTQALKVAQGLAGRLNVKVEDEKASIINLSISDHDPRMAERILSTTVEVFNEQWLAEKNKIASSTSAFIQERLDVLERELGNVDDSISNFKARNLITDLGRVSDLYLQQQSNSDAQILVLSNQKAMAQYILGLLRDKDSHHQLLPTNSGINNSVAESQITQYNTMLLQLKNSSYSTSSQNPLIIKQESELADIRRNIVATINSHIKALDIQLSSYRGVSGRANSKISQNPGQEKHLLSVEREQKVKESLYLYLLQKKEENEISTTYKSYITEMIDQPHGSDAPTSPNRRNVLIAAILLALVVPTVFLFVRETLDNTVRDKYDIKHASNLMLIGEVPLYKYDRKTKQAVAAPRFRITTLHDLMPWRKKRKQRSMLVVEADKQDIVNEAFRVIRTNLEFMTSKHNDKNVYIVTSNYEGSGKTFISTNLAIALAIKGKNILFIDGDLRHASASHIFKGPKIGLANYLADQENDWRDILVTHELYPSLHILPVGTNPPNPTELLAGERLGLLLSEARPLYDFIIIDCPPAETLADTGIIEAQADRTLFVMRSGLFERKRIDELDASTQNGKYKHLSLILNGIKLGGRYGYRFGYRYGYHYKYYYHPYGEDAYLDSEDNFFTRHWHSILYTVVCVALLALIFVGAKSILSSDDDAPVTPQTEEVSKPAEHKATDTVAKAPAPAPATTPKPAAEKKPVAATKTAVEKKPISTTAGKFTLVLACLNKTEAAETMQQQLRKEGLKNSFLHTQGNYTRIVYDRYNTREEATDQLRKLRAANPNFKDAWVLEMKR